MSEPGSGPTGCSCNHADCSDPAKHPRIVGWQDEATTDKAKIGVWWRKWRQANIGIATGESSGLVVLDIDPRNGGDESLRDLEREHGELPATPQVITGGDGQHYYFQHPGFSVRNAAGLAPGIDLKADGGMVVAPGSRHISGGAYQWEASSHPDAVPLALLPPWLLDLIGNQRRGPAPEVPAQILAGERNATFTSLAGSMRQRGMSEREIVAALLVANERCVDKQGGPAPLGEEEIQAIANSVGNYAPGDVRDYLRSVVGASTNGKSPSAPTLRLEFPEAAWHGVFSDYREAMGTTEAPDAHHFAAAITVTGWLLGRRVFVYYDRRTYANQNTVIVGPTGVSRKTGTMRRGINLGEAVDPQIPYLTAIGSAEGLLEALATAEMGPEERQQYENHIRGTRVSDRGEIDKKGGEVPELPLAPAAGRRLLAAPEEWATMLAKGRQDGTGNLGPIITAAYDCPEWFNPPTRANRIMAHKPTLSILTASAPVWVERFLTVAELISGYCNRFGYYLGDPKEAVPWPEPPRQEPRNRVVKALHDALSFWEGKEHEFTLTDAARSCWNSYYATHRSRLATYSETHAAVVQRAPTFAVKIALVFAALANDKPTISAEDMERATLVADYLEAGAGELLGSLGESPDTELERKILKRLATGDRLKKRRLHQLVGGRYGAEKLNRTLDALCKANIIQRDRDSAYYDPMVPSLRREAEQ